MFWRISRKEFSAQTGEGNKHAMRDLVFDGKVTGLLYYLHQKAVGWCSIAPREDFAALERSRTLKRINREPVWSIVCFYIPKAHRGMALLVPMIHRAVEYAHQNGARIVEGYPLNPDGKKAPVEIYMGLHHSFIAAGFKEITQQGNHTLVQKYV